MNEKLTPDEIAAMPAKSTRYLEEVQLYMENPFLEAYAAHTDKRIRETGPQAAIGGGDNWEAHGELQLAFLKSCGLKPAHSMMEIGCGTGRLARKVVPYLDKGNYDGLDISAGAVDAAKVISIAEGWSERWPRFYVGELSRPDDGIPYDFIWAFSVTIHLPPPVVFRLFQLAAKWMHSRSRFYWSYVPEQVDKRTGLKQFRHTLQTYRTLAADAGLTFQPVPEWIKQAGYEAGRWSGSQQVACSMLAGVRSAP